METTIAHSKILERGQKRRNTTIHVVLPPDLKKEFKAACVLEEVEMSQVLHGMILEWLDKRRSRQGGAGDE